MTKRHLGKKNFFLEFKKNLYKQKSNIYIKKGNRGIFRLISDRCKPSLFNSLITLALLESL